LVAGGNVPAGGGDFNILASGIGEVEEDAGGDVVVCAAPDAAKHVKALAFGVLAGQGFQEIEDGVEGVGGGEDFVAREGPVDEPVAELGRADGEDAAGWFGNADEYLAGASGEGHARPGDFHEACEG